MKIAVLVAMESELEIVSGLCQDLPGKDIVLRLCGIGKVNAAMAATELILKEKPDYLISTGCAGAMLPSMRVSDLLIASATAYHDLWCGEPYKVGQVPGFPRIFHADVHLLDLAIRLAQSNSLSFRTGLLCTGDQFFISTEEDDRIRSVHPEVLASDMESAAIAHVCEAWDVPFISLRVISDTHVSDTEQKESYDLFWESGNKAAYVKFLKRFFEDL